MTAHGGGCTEAIDQSTVGAASAGATATEYESVIIAAPTKAARLLIDLRGTFITAPSQV